MMKAHGLSYAEIGERQGWSYTKVNRVVTEGRRRFLNAFEGIESGAECERFEPIVEALSTGSATSAQVLKIRPHLRHCTTCRAIVRELHVSRLRRASLFWPMFIVAEPLVKVSGLKHEIAALVPPHPGIRRSDRRRSRRLGGRRASGDGRRDGRAVSGRRERGDRVRRDGRRPGPRRERGDTTAGESRGDDAPARLRRANRSPRSPSRRRRPLRRRRRRRASRNRSSPPSRPRRPPRAHGARPRRKRHPVSSVSRTRPPAGTTTEQSAPAAQPAQAPEAATEQPARAEGVQSRRAGVRTVIRRLKGVVAPLFYCVLASTTLRLAVRRVVPVVAVCALLLGVPATNAGCRRVHGGDLPGRPVELQHPSLHAPRHPQHADQARVQSDRTGAARSRHVERAARRAHQTRRDRPGDHDRPTRHADDRRSAGPDRCAAATAGTHCRCGPTRRAAT